MSWRDGLIPASFRSANFHVLSSDYGIGRRNVVHQYPYKDTPYVEDFGSDVDDFIIEGYIVSSNAETKFGGNELNYFPERNSLINALKKKGSGKLRHPFLGEINVNVIGKVRIRENFSQGGIARFSMKFALAGEIKYPEGTIDPITSVDKSSDDSDETSTDSYSRQYTMEVKSNAADADRDYLSRDVPAFLKSGMYSDFSAFIDMAKQNVNTYRNLGSAALTDVKNTLDDARALVLDVITLPCEIATLLINIVDSILSIANVFTSGYLGLVVSECTGKITKRKLSSDGRTINEELGTTMYKGLLEMAGSSSTTGYGAPTDETTSIGGGLTPIDVTTKNRARQGANRLSFVNLVKALCISAALRVIIRMDFTSFLLSKEAQDEAIEAIDYLLLKLGDESASDPYGDYGIYTDNREAYNKIESLRAEFINAMKKSQLALPKEIDFTPPPDGTTSLHVAYANYEDLDRSTEIFERNQPNLTHPGFIIKDKIKVLVS